VKFFQGFGAAPNTIKNWAFGTLVFFYYERVMEVPASFCALALFIALCFDAVTDPIVGSISDNWRSQRWGRRHAFMYAATLPLMVTFYLLFLPPEGLGTIGLFVWLTVFAVLVRSFMTLFVIPWSALAAEFTPDYHERTIVMAYRFLLGWIIGVSTGWLAFTFLFAPTPEFSNGLFNSAGYPEFALWATLAIGASALISTHFTRSEIPFLPLPPQQPQRFSFGNVWREAKLALSNRPFRLIFLSILVASAIGGVQATLGLYVSTYFWGLLPLQLRWFGPFMMIGAIFAFIFVRPIGVRFDKKTIIIAVSAFLIIDGMGMIVLRLADVLPANGHPWLLPLLILNETVRTALGVVSGIMGASIVADILDDQELATNERQEGMFNAALAFCGKAISGLGLLFGGLILQLLSIPRTAAVEQVDPQTIINLGVVMGLILPLFYVFSLWLLSKYPLTRAAHAEIRAALEARRSAGRESTGMGL
jgi:Na+/melibiose symporter-like transporter